MFRGDFEFHEDAAPSHLGGHGEPRAASQPTAESLTSDSEVSHPAETAAATVAAAADTKTIAAATATAAPWAPEAEKELRKIPFFVRGKARRNTERYAMERSITLITVEALYDAKAHFGS
jgi:light-independent protochlorophyllide reductase subunit B